MNHSVPEIDPIDDRKWERRVTNAADKLGIVVSGRPLEEVAAEVNARIKAGSWLPTERPSRQGSASSAVEPSQHVTRNRYFIATHWRGEFPLWLSYWVFGFLANIAVVVFVLTVSSTFDATFGYNPHVIFGFIVLIWSVVGVVATWQLIGIWRSANRYIDERNRRGRKAPWGGLAKIAVILGLLRLLGDFNTTGLPQLREGWRMAFLDDPSIPSYALRAMRDGTEIEISGGIKYGLHDEFLQLLDATPRARVIHLNSGGGRIGEATKLYKTIKKRGLITYVVNQCYSACTLIFVAGSERWIAGRAKLGFHSGDFPGLTEQDRMELNEVQKRILLAQGISRSFVYRALSTSHESMWRPSIKELKRARVITGIADDNRFALSGVGANLSSAQFEKGLKTAIPALGVLEKRSPDEFNEIASAYYKGYLLGETKRNLVRRARSKILPIIRSNLPNADGDVVISFAKLIIDQYKALAEQDHRLCYEYSSGVPRGKNFAKFLPEPLIKRELVLAKKILLTSKHRPQVPDEKLERYWSVIVERIENRHGAQKLQLFQEKRVDPVDHAAYCEVSQTMLREIIGLQEPQAALLLRQVFRSIQGGQ